ncbi:small multi-drug export protein [Candidatus Woesearchaeota archaeon]|nr:small multi-drug export protein [Candidatus Woesearchaeota archaeon]
MALEFITTILLSMLPVSELRGAIPYGIIYGLNPVLVFITAVVSNILVIPIIFVFLNYIHNHLMRIKIYEGMFGRFIERVRRKAHPRILKYGYLGLTLFVAVPLPVTGAYTGTLAAWLFGMERKKAFLALSLGVVMAGIIVTAAVLSGVEASTFIGDRLTN